MNHLFADSSRRTTFDAAYTRNQLEIHKFERIINNASNNGLFEAYWDQSKLEMSPNVINYFKALGYNISFKYVGESDYQGTINWSCKHDGS